VIDDIDPADRRPCPSGYVVTLTSGERLHIWPGGLVVSEVGDEPHAVGVSGVTEQALTVETADLLKRIWTLTLDRWRGRR
jgi:hypothetical protein